MVTEELKREAFCFIGNNDEYGDIIPDGKVNEASELFVDFIDHLESIGAIEKK